MHNLYLRGTGGLGNCLFQIATGVYYCEKYNYKMILIRNHSILFGSSNCSGKIKCLTDSNNNFLSYDKSIFSNLEFIDNNNNDKLIVFNNFTDNKIKPENGIDIEIQGYNQNVNLFKEYMKYIPKYLNLNDENIKNYILNKYGDITNGICIGMRIGDDFKHMNKITAKSYITALDYYKQLNFNMENIFIISDVKHNFNLQQYNCIEINESDIIQIYFGLMCKHYILCESTFHLWIAYLGTINDTSKNVICFNDTDITNRNLSLDTWIKLDY